MNSKSVRVQRVEKEILHLVALYLQHDLADPMEASVSVTAVDAAGDLRRAGVYFRIIGNDEAFAEASSILERERKAIQKHVAETLDMKFSPMLRFHFGHATASDDVDRLLAEM